MRPIRIGITATSLTPGNPVPALDELKVWGAELKYNGGGKPLRDRELSDFLSDCDGCIAGLDFYTREVIESLERCRVISRYGVGVDRVDLAAARFKGIRVCNTPGANAQAVADLTFALLLAVCRRIPFLDRKTREGQWTRSTGVELYGKTLGILGLGAVGKGVARRAAGFSMPVFAYDPYPDERYALSNGIAMVEFDELIKGADFISLHLPLDDKTRYIINAETMNRMKEGAVIINTARGGLIDEQAAYDFIKSGRLGGLGLDAYDEEPLRDSPLFELDNVVFTPHTGAHTREASMNMAAMAAHNLMDLLSGKPCPYTVV
jgi:D-3-phosphoglycerate dehydrogenase